MAEALAPGRAALSASRAESGLLLDKSTASRPARIRLTRSVGPRAAKRSRPRARAVSNRVGATSVDCMLAEASRMSARCRGGSVGVAGRLNARAANPAASNCSKSSNVSGGRRWCARPIDARGRSAHKNRAGTRSRRRLPDSQCTR